MSETKTPRTDAVIADDKGDSSYIANLANHARQLERELADAKEAAFTEGESEADGGWMAAIQSKNWGGAISLAEGNEIASDARYEVISSIHEQFARLNRELAEAKAKAEAWEAVAYFRPHPKEWFEGSMEEESERQYEAAMKNAGKNTYTKLQKGEGEK